MSKFFRFQEGHYTLEEMQNFTSGDGGDGGTEGICACQTVGDLLRNTVFSSTSATAEVLVLEGEKLSTIYDGVRIYPTAIVARFTPREFDARAYEIEEESSD